MAFCARRSLASGLARHLSCRLHPSLAHLLPSHSHGDSPSTTNSSPSLPLPPPPTCPSRLPEPSRTTLLPFGLHLAGHRSFSSSSGEIDVAGVLADAAASAAPPAPFPGEVATAAADSLFPVAALQHFIDAVHSFTGLNWWACIALTTVLIRSAMIPFLLKQRRALVKLNGMRPDIEEIKTYMQNSTDPQSVQEGQRRMTALFKKHRVTPFAPLTGLFIQGPVFLTFFFAISNMAEKVASFKGGGAFWFTDLTTPDDLYIFPVLTSLTFLTTVELNMHDGMEGNPMASKMKNIFRGVAVLAVPVTVNFPKAIFCYWVTSNMFSLVYGFVIGKPAVRKLLGLADSVPQPTLSAQPNFTNRPNAVPAARSSLSIKKREPEQSRYTVSDQKSRKEGET